MESFYVSVELVPVDLRLPCNDCHAAEGRMFCHVFILFAFQVGVCSLVVTPVSSASNWVKHCKTQFESRTRLTILLPIRSCESCAGSSPSWSKTALPRRNTHFCWLKAIIQNTLPYSCLPGACPAHVCGLRIFEVLTTALRGTSDWNMV